MPFTLALVPLLEASGSRDRVQGITALQAKQVVLITASVENGCEYCVAAHSTLALKVRVPAEVVESLRTGKPLQEAGLEAVRRLTQLIVARLSVPCAAVTVDLREQAWRTVSFRCTPPPGPAAGWSAHLGQSARRRGAAVRGHPDCHHRAGRRLVIHPNIS